MKRILLLIFISWSISSNTFSQSWKALPIPLPSDNRIEDVFFVDSNKGWVVTFAGQIMYTENGGLTWTNQQALGMPQLRSIEFFDENHGYIGSLTHNYFLKTTNGGKNWVRHDTAVHSNNKKMCGLAKANDSVMYGVGTYQGVDTRIFKTTDRGNSWHPMPLPANVAGLVDVHFFNQDTGLVSGSYEDPEQKIRAAIFKTFDGGQTWTPVYIHHRTIPGWTLVWKLQFISETNGFASIEIPTDTAFVLKTTDKGNNWQRLAPIHHQARLQGVGFLNDTLGWAGGDAQGFWETRNGGQTWNRLQIGRYFNRFFRINDKIAFAAGEYVYKYGDLISGIDKPEPKTKLHSIQSIYPNPAKDKVNFKINLVTDDFLSLRLFNAEGVMLKYIMGEDRKKGVHKENIDISSYPPGVYHLYMQSNFIHLSEKFVIE